MEEDEERVWFIPIPRQKPPHPELFESPKYLGSDQTKEENELIFHAPSEQYYANANKENR